MSLLLYAALVCAALSVLYMGRAKLVYQYYLLMQIASTLLLVARMALRKLKVKVRARWYKYRQYYKVSSSEVADPANKPAPNVVMKRPSERIKVS
jgi:hypothetical protein